MTPSLMPTTHGMMMMMMMIMMMDYGLCATPTTFDDIISFTI